MFPFLKNSFAISPSLMKPELEKFLSNVKHLEKNRFETRSFAYLDIISWLESKVYQKPMGEIIYNKYLQSKRKLPSKQLARDRNADYADCYDFLR